MAETQEIVDVPEQVEPTEAPMSPGKVKKAKTAKTEKKPKKVKKPKERKKRHYTNGICKFGNVYWICIRRNGIKVERSTDATTRAEADLILSDLKKELPKLIRSTQLKTQGSLLTPVQPAPVATPATVVAQAVQTVLGISHSLEQSALQWQKDKKGKVSDRYLAQMLEAVQIHMKDWKHWDVSDISSDVMNLATTAYLATDGKKVLKGKTISVPHTTGGANRLIRLMSALFGYIVETKQWLPARPWKCKEGKVQKTSEPIVWPENTQQFLTKVDESTSKSIIRMGVRMQIGMGLRETETSTADWRWLDRRTQTYCPGKTKNRDSREVPIPIWLFEELMAEWERQGRPARGLIIPYKDGEKPVYRGYTKNAIAAAGKKIGVEGLHPHRLRWTFATGHHENFTKPSTLMKMLGHKHQSTTDGYIIHRSVDAREAQERLAKAQGFYD